MSLRRPVVHVALCSLVMVGACSKDEAKPEAPAASAPTPPASAPVAQAPVGPRDDEIPTEEDFEAEASQLLSASNLEAELDKLEKEIDAD